MKTKRQMMEARRRKKKLYRAFGWGGTALVLLALAGYAILTASRPIPDQVAAVMPDTSHVAEGTDPGPYNTDPPTSGKHYEATLDAGFYEEGEVQAEYPAGHLVHNLEHGYVIFWYNCAVVGESECASMKEEIRGVLDQENNFKVIAFPWSSIDVPVVATSWGRLLRFDEFDPKQARDFVQRNRNKAPEPNAP